MCTYAMLSFITDASFVLRLLCVWIREEKAWYALTARAQFPQGFSELI